MNDLLIIGIGIVVLGLILVLCARMHKKSNGGMMNGRNKTRSVSDDQTLSGALSNVSNQISSYVGYDPSGNSPYNSDAFVQYVNNALQLLQQSQSSGSINKELGQYIGKLLNQVKLVTPLEKSSIDEQEMGIVAGQLYMCVHALQNGISWEGAGSDVIQDVEHGISTYQKWLGDSLSSAAAGAYMNDPVAYNLRMDADKGYPSSVMESLPTDLAEADAWYWTNGNINRARVWYDLGQFIGFQCIYMENGDSCL